MRKCDGRILILGGTAEAYAVAERLAATSVCIITALAGRTRNPRRPAGRLRIGGFGGVAGLGNYLLEENIRLVIDATHPFARHITANAIAATAMTGIALLRLERPPWQRQAGDHWTEVAAPEEAARAIPEGARVFLAIGRQHLEAFSQRPDVTYVARMIEIPETVPPFNRLHIILGKPEKAEDEARFLQHNRIDCLVCRNSGGAASYEKVIAARKLALPVIMITRGPHAGIATVCNVEETINYLKNHYFDEFF